ncbi:hypothetical protein HUK84_12120 [Nguyenibacter vanlangensis]|uniref:Uncharacterized protein n=1 Tax=Nguyenibacter vanlangensis TaxID=1216886 RepID=A0A7Y7IXZ7_9PROT|nr:hypothetical protein [Nguyenibacter vanlangensis]NVN11850.1 hypothetical protein [Nguyenibacter vanlangensis]
MALSDFAVRQAKPAVAAYSLADGDGLALYVPLSGGKIVAFSLLLAGKAELLIPASWAPDWAVSGGTHLWQGRAACSGQAVDLRCPS